MFFAITKDLYVVQVEFIQNLMSQHKKSWSR
jgi:hypothetical protein